MRYKIKIHKSMVFNTVLKIPPKKKILVYAQIILVCFMLWARDVLGVPSAITYITDVITITLLFFQFFKIRKGIRGTRVKVQIYIVTAILVCMMLGVVLNLVKPLLVLWGLRNSFRFFVFFLICVGLLSEYDIEKIIAFFKTFFFLNVAMMTFQYFVQGYRDDYLGGFFGTDSGCNAYVCVMLCIITTIVLAEFLKSKISLSTLFVYCVACMYIATLAELKIYFFEFIIIIGFQLLYMKPSRKMVGICISAAIVLIIGFNLIKQYNPDILNIFLDKDVMNYYLSGNGYTNSGDLNRFSAIQKLYDMFFKGSPLHALFGFGLGSCEQSSYTFLSSAFYRQYEYLHYRWFSHAWIFLEQGVIGLVLTTAFFLSIDISILKKRKKSEELYDLAVFSFIPTCIIGLIYNSALELETAYLIALVCAFPFILEKRNMTVTAKRG